MPQNELKGAERGCIFRAKSTWVFRLPNFVFHVSTFEGGKAKQKKRRGKIGNTYETGDWRENFLREKAFISDCSEAEKMHSMLQSFQGRLREKEKNSAL